MDGGDPLLQNIADRWSESAVGTGSGASATHLAAPNLQPTVTGIQVSSDAASLVTIESPSGTVLWRMRYAAAFDRSYTFPPGVLVGAGGQALLVKIATSTSNCEANIQGVSYYTGTLAKIAAGAHFGQD